MYVSFCLFTYFPFLLSSYITFARSFLSSLTHSSTYILTHSVCLYVCLHVCICVCVRLSHSHTLLLPCVYEARTFAYICNQMWVCVCVSSPAHNQSYLPNCSVSSWDNHKGYHAIHYPWLKTIIQFRFLLSLGGSENNRILGESARKTRGLLVHFDLMRQTMVSINFCFHRGKITKYIQIYRYTNITFFIMERFILKLYREVKISYRPPSSIYCQKRKLLSSNSKPSRQMSLVYSRFTIHFHLIHDEFERMVITLKYCLIEIHIN